MTDREALEKIGNIVGRPTTHYASADSQLAQQAKKLDEIFHVVREQIMPRTPTLDKFSLHPLGGHCTCFSSPYSACRICCAIKEQQERWKNLKPVDKKKADA